MNPRVIVPLYTLISFGVAMAATGVLVAPSVVWPNILLSGFLLVGLALAGGFLVAVHDASSGRWLGPVRKIACSMTRLIVPGAVISLVAIVIGGGWLYPAFHGHLDHNSFKAFWLNRPFFTARALVYAVAWVLSLRMLRSRRSAAAFLVVFGVTVWLASFDWIMSLEPHWASTMFGVYHFAGLFTAGLAVVAIVTAHRSRTDARITSDHLHDVVKLLFGFSTFWMYIWFSQAMLIWYGNLPEETGYYTARAEGPWGVLFWAVVVMMWVVPFLALLSEGAKRNRTTVIRVSVVILIGHWLDLFVSIAPASMPELQLTGWELAIGLATFAAVGAAVTRREPELQPVTAPV